MFIVTVRHSSNTKYIFSKPAEMEDCLSLVNNIAKKDVNTFLSFTEDFWVILPSIVVNLIIPVREINSITIERET